MVNECYLFGGLIMDCYYAIDAFPERGQDGFITAEKMMAGGCAVNMAVTIENLGGKSHVISGMGDDPSSVNLMDYMTLILLQPLIGKFLRNLLRHFFTRTDRQLQLYGC